MKKPFCLIPRSLCSVVILLLICQGTALPVRADAGQAVLGTSAIGDSLWCPEGVVPVASTDGCSDSYTSFASLLQYLSANQPNQSGVIWIGQDFISSANDAGVTSFTLDGAANLPNMKDYALTIQGGWTGDSAGTVSSKSPSEFDANLNVVNWSNTVTLNDILVTQASGAGMTLSIYGPVFSPSLGAGLGVTTTSDVNLSDINSTGNTLGGGVISNGGSVSINGSNFSDNGAFIGGLYVTSKGAIHADNLTASGNNGLEGAVLFNDSLGAQGDITLTGTNTFDDNNGDGLMISSHGSINLGDVSASRNGLTGAYVYNASGFGNVTFSGSNQFNQNVGSGMYVYSDGVITMDNATASGNGSNGVILVNGLGAPATEVVFTGTNIFQGNKEEGLYINTGGDLVTYDNLTTYETSVLASPSSDELPGGLPDGNTFISALQLIQTAPSGEVVISFPIPYSMQDANLAILYWDGTQWVDLATATFRDSRRVLDGGHKTDNGYFQASVNFGGIFAFVAR